MKNYDYIINESKNWNMKLLNKNRLKYGFWKKIVLQSIIILAIIFGVHLLFKDSSFRNSEYLGLEICAILLYFYAVLDFLRKKHYIKILVSLLILPVAMYFSHYIIEDYHFRLNIANILAPLAIIAVSLILDSFFPDRGLKGMLILAAEPVKTFEDGYTTRPYSTGQHEYKEEDILGFSEYMESIKFCTAYTLENKVILLYKEGVYEYFRFLKPIFSKYTYVEIDFSGNLNVHIGRKDYDNFSKELTYDELCRGFGNKIHEFMQHYTDGKKELIFNDYYKVLPLF